jgi:hypothetical protein
MSEERKAYPFALVGFFVTDKPVEEAFKEEVKPEDLEKIQDLIKEVLFKEDVDLAIAPFVVPPDQVDDALHQLADVLFEGEKEDG